MNDDSEVDELFAIVRLRYGDRLNDDELEEVRKGVRGVVDMARKVRAVTLDNVDEPPSVFIPYRKEG